MWIKFHFDTPIRNDLYSSYCRYLYDKINDELSSIINDIEANGISNKEFSGNIE